MAAKKLPEKAFFIAPHQNELPTAMPFMKSLARDFKSQGILVDCTRLQGSCTRGWQIRKILSDKPDFPSSNVSFHLSMMDAITRATFIKNCVSPGALVVEVHAWLPDKDIGFSLEDQDIGNGFNLLPFIRLMEHYYQKADKNPDMMATLSRILGKGENAAKLLFSTQSPIHANRSNIVCIEIPGAEAKPMVVEGKPVYSLYYDSKGELRENVSDFEKLYCTHSIHGKGYSDTDITMVSKLLLDNYK